MKSQVSFTKLMMVFMILFSSVAGQTDDAGIANKSATELTKITDKMNSGYYGAKGEKIMKARQRTLANYMAVKAKAKECDQIQEMVPSLPTDQYLFQNNKIKTCVSRAAVVTTMVNTGI